MPRRYTRAARRTKEPAMDQGRQCRNRKIRQLAPPIIEQRPIWLVPCAGLHLPAPRVSILMSFLVAIPVARKTRKARKVGKWRAAIPGQFAVRQIWVWLLPAGFNSALDGFHRGAMPVLT